MNRSFASLVAAASLGCFSCRETEQPYEQPGVDTKPAVTLPVPEMARHDARVYLKGAINRAIVGAPFALLDEALAEQVQFWEASAETVVTVVGGEDGPVRVLDLTKPNETTLFGYGRYAGIEEVHRRNRHVDAAGVHGTRVGVYRTDGAHGHTGAWYYNMARAGLVQNYVTELEEWDWQSGDAELDRFQTSAWPFVPNLVRTRYPYHTIFSLTPTVFDSSLPMDVEFERTDAVSPTVQVPDCVRIHVKPASANSPAHLLYFHEQLGLVEIVWKWSLDDGAEPGREVLAEDGFSIRPASPPSESTPAYTHPFEGYWLGYVPAWEGHAVEWEPHVSLLSDGKPDMQALVLRPGIHQRPHSGFVTVTGEFYYPSYGRVAVAGLVNPVGRTVLLTGVAHSSTFWLSAVFVEGGLRGHIYNYALEDAEEASDPLRPEATASGLSEIFFKAAPADMFADTQFLGTLPEGPRISCELSMEDSCGGESCCTSIELSQGGRVLLGSGENEADTDFSAAASVEERPEHVETVSGFSLDKYPVTLGRFQAFLEVWRRGWRPEYDSGAHPHVEGSGWSYDWWLPDGPLVAYDCEDNWSHTEPNEVVGCASWYQAFAFCVWDGGRLPTEAEWEYVAAGGEEDRLFPWGSEPTPTEPRWNGSSFDFPRVPGPVSSAGRFGHRDLVGTSFEWVLDRYTPSSYTGRFGCTDCSTQSGQGDGRILRGGTSDLDSEAFRLEYSAMFLAGLDAEPKRAAYRAAMDGWRSKEFVGFRCARDLSAEK